MYTPGAEVKGIIESYKNELSLLGIRAQSMILYGSYSRGDQRPDSDVDLIVISSDFSKLNLRERLEVLGIASARIRKPVEARGYTSEEIEKPTGSSFLEEILRIGVVVG